MVGSHNSSSQIIWGDRTIAAVLLMAAILGIIFNTISLAYYPSRKARRERRQHYQNTWSRRIYPTVYMVDLAICISIIPIIQSLISNLEYLQPRILMGEEVLNTDAVNETLQSIPTLPSFSLYLVGVLSFCRLVLKFWKRAKLIPGIVCVFMVSYFVLDFCFEHTLLLISENEVNIYESGDMFNRNKVFRRAVMVSRLIISTVPITISFITHMVVYLCNERKLDSSRRASITALVFTFIYAIAHITAIVDFLFNIYYLIANKDEVILSYYLLNKSIILLCCTWPRISVMIISINSLLSSYLKLKRMSFMWAKS